MADGHGPPKGIGSGDWLGDLAAMLFNLGLNECPGLISKLNNRERDKNRPLRIGKQQKQIGRLPEPLDARPSDIVGNLAAVNCNAVNANPHCDLPIQVARLNPNPTQVWPAIHQIRNKWKAD